MVKYIFPPFFQLVVRDQFSGVLTTCRCLSLVPCMDSVTESEAGRKTVAHRGTRVIVLLEKRAGVSCFYIFPMK